MNSLPRWLIVSIMLGVLVLIGGAAWFYVAQERHLRQETEASLLAIAQLKADQIAEWRQDRLAEANVLVESPYFIEGVAQCLVERRPEAIEKMLVRLLAFQTHARYSAILLVDPEGQLQLSVPSGARTVGEHIRQALVEAFKERKVVMTDLHAGPGDLPPHLDVIAPVYARGGSAIKPLGALILRSDARRFLYPLIQFWPTPSRSAETLLVRRDGDEVLFLNELRHQPGTALKLRLPLTRKDLPAVMAVEGKEGVVKGVDYRGVDVLSILMAVPNSPWFMVAKVDEEEVTSGWRERSILIALLTLSVVALLSTGLALVWQRNRKAHFRELFQAEAARRKSEERYGVTLMSVGDGVVATDAEGRVELLNQVAEALTGWKQEDALGKPLEEVFRIVNEETRRPVETPVARVINEGIVIGLANHTILIDRSGTERPIADSGAPIRNDEGTITGVVLVFRDQTRERAAEKAVRESEQRLTHVLSVSPGITFTLDAERFTATWISPNIETILGYTPEEALQPDWWIHHVHPEDRSKVLDGAARIFAQDRLVNEYRFSKSDGEQIWVHGDLRLVRDDQGNPVEIVGAWTDITERKEAEKDLRESEERFRILADGAFEGVIISRAGKILDCNQVFCQMSGYTLEELVRMNAGEIVAPEFRKIAAEHIRSQSEAAYEAAFVRKNGGVVAVLAKGKTIPYEGGPARISSVRDITAAKKAQEVQRRLATAIEQSAEAILITDPGGIIQYVNPAMERISGFTREELLGQTPRVFRSGEHGAKFYQELWDTIEGGDIWSGRLVNKKKDGSLFHEEATISPVKDGSGKITNFVAVKRDITEHLELSKQLLQAQKMEVVGTLAGGVAHDFNNLLQVVLGYSDLMISDSNLPGAYRDDLARIHHAAQNGADLIQRLLTLSRKTEMKPCPIDLNSHIEQLQKMLSRILPKMIEMELSLADGLAAVNADPSQMEQILINLAINARDAMPEGGKLAIQTENVTLDEHYGRLHLGAKPGPYVLLCVSDTGQGMDKETLAHIFEPFFTTKGPGKGTGLGLSMVYGIVKQHDGHIMCYSEIGKGTIFKIYLPALVSDEELRKVETRPMPRGGSETVLIVDDDDLIRDLGSRGLRSVGYRVLEASTGQEALEMYAEQGSEIAAVVLDLIMPGISGKQCLEGLLELDPFVKVIIASGYAANGVTREALAAGARAFVRKPYDMYQLLEVVRAVIDEEGARRAEA